MYDRPLTIQDCRERMAIATSYKAFERWERVMESIIDFEKKASLKELLIIRRNQVSEEQKSECPCYRHLSELALEIESIIKLLKN